MRTPRGTPRRTSRGTTGTPILLNSEDAVADLSKRLWMLQAKMQDFDLCLDMLPEAAQQNGNEGHEAMLNLQFQLDQEVDKVLRRVKALQGSNSLEEGTTQ